MDSIELIREFLGERLGVAPEKVVSEAPLDGLGVDSLMMLELMFEFEDRFGIKLPSDLKNPRSVGEMAATMDGLISTRQAA
ncbi:MAG TPA: phosphopantetheine-binding protein [Aromatoleum sp.]|uniref:acyl carrier protein n=1 Tax=Aromatoleum sp. TaxID=2307007 RepID=UPI002B488EBC|nr:phosphopantetheine-binding protein [Aromatoleum sp.]HJV26963.1 phosphopantetheine-binding protein [Aromatoleum sp.]